MFRPFFPEDVDALAVIVGDAETVRFVDDGQPLSWEGSELWIQKSRENVQRFGWGTGAVVELATGRLIGWGGFARPEGQPEEIIYGFAAECHGKGLGTELVQGLVAYAVETLGLPEIRATLHPDNARSARILERAGFVRSESAMPSSHLWMLRVSTAPSAPSSEGTPAGNGDVARRDVGD